MGRLIDADALSHKFFEIGCHITKIHPMDVMNIISEQPTAYDVEKVVEEIKRCSGNGYRDIDGDYVPPMIKTETAIDIVKRGGVE